MFLSAQPDTRTRELNSDGGGHWYHTDGRPQHTVLSKDGKPRNTTKRDARKLGLFPSVTTITKVIANPSLDRWKQQQIFNACIANPLKSGDELSEYESRVRAFAQKKMVDARAFGSLFHAAIDELNKTGFLTEEYNEVKPFVQHYIQWTRDEQVQFLDTEFTAVNERLGYAGQVDALAVVGGKLTLLDYKTQDVKEDSKGQLKPNWYESWIWQLAAYKNASWPNKPRKIQQVMSVVLCSQAPCYPITKIWTTEEVADAWKVFQAANQIWQLTNSFDPAANAREVADGQVAA